MTTDGVRFYLRHRRQISEWANLEKRVDALMRDAVKEGAVEKALNLWKGESGITDADFYVRSGTDCRRWQGRLCTTRSSPPDERRARRRAAGRGAIVR